MILPTKHLREDEVLLGIGAQLLLLLSNSDDFSRLWEKAKKLPNVATFERFILALDLLFILGMVELTAGKIVRTAHAV